MREQPFVVPAEGTVEYQYFVVDPGFTEDKWIKAAQLIPGNRSVVHHGIVFVRPPDGSTFKGVGWLTAYVPGQRLQPVPDGMARRVPANSKLVFQMHYTPTGREQQDLSRVGIVFEDESRVTHELYTLLAMNQQFEIPPHADDFAVEARLDNLPANAELLAIAPHMHLRGKAFRATGVRDRDSEILLEVPRYDFNWQHVYRLAQPFPLSTLDSIKIAAIFNNSESNPVNPDASQRVTWGDQTWEEMAVAFFEVAEPLGSRDAAHSAVDAGKDASSVDPQKVDQFVARFMTRFDTNQDGAVHRLETPLSLRNFGFGELDRDGDDRLSPREVRDAAMQRTDF
jgi:hypothetical protein